MLLFLCIHLQLEGFAFSRILDSLWNDVKEVFCEDKWYSLSVDAEFLLEMSQKMTKIDVKYTAIFIDHDVIRISVTDTEDKGGDTIASTWMSKSFNCLLVSEI